MDDMLKLRCKAYLTSVIFRMLQWDEEKLRKGTHSIDVGMVEVDSDEGVMTVKFSLIEKPSEEVIHAAD